MPVVPLAHQEIGSGPPLVVLHGLFGSGTNWRTVARRLAGAHRVLLVDMRNHGSSPHAEEMDYASLAADVRAFMDTQELASAPIMGHSMGGKAAMRLALETPERVSRLCVVDIAPAVSAHDHQDVIRALRAVDLAALARRSDADAQLRSLVPEAGLRGFLLQNLAADGEGFRWRIGLDAIETGHPALLAFDDPDPGCSYDGPCLFVRGAASDYVLDEHGPVIRGLFPRARVHTVADAGHWVHAERPDGFVEAVAGFLAGAPDGP